MSIKVASHEPPSLLPPNFHDIRDEAEALYERSEAHRKKIGPCKDRGGWEFVQGVCLHQTAVELGERPGRWANLGAHVGVTLSGKIIWVHDLEKIVWHGNGWNNRCVGIEIDGRYPGVAGDDSTLWKPRDGRVFESELRDETVEAAKVAIRWVCDRVERYGGRVKVLVAHRQASKTRRSDPGSEIWQRVARPLHRELVLDDGGPGFEIGGYPIPESWDPDKRGIPY